MLLIFAAGCQDTAASETVQGSVVETLSALSTREADQVGQLSALALVEETISALSTQNAGQAAEISAQGTIGAALAGELATQAAIVMENARLFQETKLAVEELAALQALSLDITAQVTLPELLERLMMRARHLVRASGCVIYLGDRKGDTLTAVARDLPWIRWP